MPPVPPFKLSPAYKDYLWGGARLKTVFGKNAPHERIAESWELSAHPDGQSAIATGGFAGMSFGEFAKARPDACGLADGAAFPFLIKLIDANAALSIQVHPNDAYARRVENDSGKTEMWVVIEAEPGAFIYHGFEREISLEELKGRLAGGTITEALHKRPVRNGDVIFIPAGTIHAIGAGILLAEIQQSSNVTYRVYDYGRTDANGLARTLHIDKALDVITRKPAHSAPPGAKPAERARGGGAERLVRCPYFNAHRLNVDGEYACLSKGGGFAAALVIDGELELRCGNAILALSKGDCAFIPSGHTRFSLRGNGCAIMARR